MIVTTNMFRNFSGSNYKRVTWLGESSTKLDFGRINSLKFITKVISSAMVAQSMCFVAFLGGDYLSYSGMRGEYCP